jgi:hypothetical protein
MADGQFACPYLVCARLDIDGDELAVVFLAEERANFTLVDGIAATFKLLFAISRLWGVHRDCSDG